MKPEAANLWRIAPTEKYFATCAAIEDGPNFNRPIEQVTPDAYKKNVVSTTALPEAGGAGKRYLSAYIQKVGDEVTGEKDYEIRHRLTTVTYNGAVYEELNVDSKRLTRLKRGEEPLYQGIFICAEIEKDPNFNRPLEQVTPDTYKADIVSITAFPDMFQGPGTGRRYLTTYVPKVGGDGWCYNYMLTTVMYNGEAYKESVDAVRFKSITEGVEPAAMKGKVVCQLIERDSNFNRPREEVTVDMHKMHITAISALPSAYTPSIEQRYIMTWIEDVRKGASSYLRTVVDSLVTVLRSGVTHMVHMDSACLYSLKNAQEVEVTLSHQSEVSTKYFLKEFLHDYIEDQGRGF